MRGIDDYEKRDSQIDNKEYFERRVERETANWKHLLDRDAYVYISSILKIWRFERDSDPYLEIERKEIKF